MENILISSSPAGNANAAKIQAALSKKGYSVILAERQNYRNTDFKLAVMVIAADSETDASQIAVLDYCAQKEINVLPFVSEKMPETLSAHFFLDEHVWIDNIGRSIDASIGDLTDCLSLNFGVLSQKATKKKNAQQSQLSKKSNVADPVAAKAGKNKKQQQAVNSGNLFKNLFYMSLAVIAVLLVILLSGGASQQNREANNQQANISNSKGASNITIQLDNNLRNSEKALVGRWTMVDYSDNQYRATREDSLNLQEMVNALLNRAQLVFDANKNFQRIGFAPEPETGRWEYSPDSKYLKLQPTGVNQYDVVQIQEVNNDKMVLVVQENVESNKILTKMTFKKIANQ